MSPIVVDAEEISEYELTGSKIEILGGHLQTAKHKESESQYLIKTMPKSNPNSEKGYNIEKTLSEKVHCGTLATATSFFEDNDNFYVVYELPKGEHLSAALDEATAKGPCIQFMRMLDSLHKQDVLYLRPAADNCWLTERGRLTVVGLDFGQLKTGGEPSISKFAQWDGTAEEATDLLSLGCFIHKALHGNDNLFKGDSKEPEAKAPHKKLVKKCCDDKEDRKKFDPHKKSFLTKELSVSVEETKIQVNEYYVSWADGIAVGVGETEVGFSVSETKLYMNQGDGSLSLGADGFTMGDEAYRREINIGPDGLTFKEGRSSMNLGPNGLNCDIGYWGDFDIDASGLHYRKSGKHLDITESGIDFDFDADDVKKKVGSSGVELGICKMKIKIGKDGFKLSCGKPKVEIGKDGFVLGCGGAVLGVGKEGFKLEAGVVTLLINDKGATIGLGENTCVINGEGLTFSAEGFTFKVGSAGASMENENGPIDLAAYKCTIPSISISLPGMPKIPNPPSPPLPMPGIPGVPKVSLPKIGFGKKKESKPDGKPEDFLPEGETIKLRAITTKKKLFRTIKMETILTSSGKTLILDSHCHKKLDEFALAKDPDVDKKKKKVLELKDDKGKKRKLTFKEESDRDKFADAYKA